MEIDGPGMTQKKNPAPEPAQTTRVATGTQPAPSRITSAGWPIFGLRGGPCDGWATDDERIESTLFFPDRVLIEARAEFDGRVAYEFKRDRRTGDRVGEFTGYE